MLWTMFQDKTTDELVERNGAHLLAHHLQAMERKYLDAIAEHAADKRRTIRDLDRAHKIGLVAQKLHAEGRKTVKLEALIQETP